MVQSEHSGMSTKILRSKKTENRCLDEGAAFGLVEGSISVQHARFPSGSLPPGDEERQRFSEKENPTAYSKDIIDSVAKSNEVGIAEQDSSGKERGSKPEDESNYPHGFTLIALTIALMISTFMVALDTNVIGRHTVLYAALCNATTNRSLFEILRNTSG